MEIWVFKVKTSKHWDTFERHCIQANIRRLIKQYFLFKFNDLKEVKQFYDEIASAYFPNFELFKDVYRRVTNVEHNFLLIDNDPKDDDLKIRQNFNELIKI